MPEVLKKIGIDDIILSFSNKILLNNQTPEQFSTMNILPIPESGDLSITSNYRDIALTSLVAKVINRMILNRIRPISSIRNCEAVKAASGQEDPSQPNSWL